MICGIVPPEELTPASRQPPAQRAPADSTSERLLFEHARRGSRSAVDTLFERYRPWLLRWARGRLPWWVRGDGDTSDLVQDALQRTFARLPFFESRHAGALRAYLQHAVENRIRDQLRRVTRRRRAIMPDAPVQPSDSAAPQHQELLDDQTRRRYLDGLQRLSARDRRLIVGRAELGHSYRQLALVEGLPSAEAARKALRRALSRLIDRMSNAQ